jgi:hypothetical protein
MVAFFDFGALFCVVIVAMIVFGICVIFILKWIFGTKVVVQQNIQQPYGQGPPPGQPAYCRYCGAQMGTGNQCPKCGKWS